jgi:phage gp46-like protein
MRAESYDTEGMSWFAERKVPFSVHAEWPRRGWLRTTVRVGEYAVAREQQVAG